ncbi:MAG: amino acid ABC transporter permease [Anaerolineae bacterium]|nr:amino acid ABC transporter permease [Anaerolineae bacterium]MDK1117670.1 amino acid ABC transporter permease [Anaerolineae bacterium]
MSEELDLLLIGLGVTALLTVVTTLLALVAGVAIGGFKISGTKTLARIANLYIDLFRNIPALVLIIFIAFGLPNILPPDVRKTIFFDNQLVNILQKITGLSLPYYMLAAVTGLTLNTSAYLAELFRAGVGTISRSTLEAARTLGAGPKVTFFQILLPQGLAASFPAISTRLIHNMKNTSLASFVAIPDLFHASQAVISRTFRATEYLLLATVLYLLLAFVFSGILDRVGRQLSPSR